MWNRLEGGGILLKELVQELMPHKGKIFGSIFGLILGWLIIRYGVIRGLFVTLCVGIGFYLGNRYDARGDITDLIDRFLR